MILQALIALMLLAQAAPAATPAPAAPPAVDPVIAEIDRLMAKWKGKSLGNIQGRLGLTEVIKEANDGKVIFWMTRAETLACGVGEGGAMRCASLIEDQCRLGVAVDKDGLITNWKAFGGAEACRKFVTALSKS